MTDTRGDGSGYGHGDPYADLADIVGGGEDVHSGRRPSAGYDLATPVAGRSGSRKPFYGDDEQSEIAVMGLCEPAAPRLSGPVETGVLAPERHIPEPEPAYGAAALDDFDELIASEMAALGPQPGAWAQVPAQSAYEEAYEPRVAEIHSELPYEPQAEPAAYGYAPVSHDAVAPAHAGFRAQTPWQRSVIDGSRRRRVLFFGGGVAAVALVGLFGAFAASAFMGGGIVGGGEPILIRADAEPVKMAPEEPGGRVIPNQNKAVYERVARNGAIAGPPAQDMLISAAEEPIDISFEDQVSNLPGVMVGVDELPVEGEVQLAQVASSPEADAVSSILQPHRVRTFEVRPDGTLVPREAAADPAQAQTQDPVEAIGQPVAPFSTDLPAPAPAAEAPAAPVEAAPAPAPSETAPPAPAAAPAPEAAAAAPTPTVPSDAFFVQISSQPSEALARESMAALQSRYAGAIGGRSLTIQPAEIEGRGTFYRVRVVTASRDEANSVCEQLQSAGGSCFVTR